MRSKFSALIRLRCGRKMRPHWLNTRSIGAEEDRVVRCKRQYIATEKFSVFVLNVRHFRPISDAASFV